MTLSGDISYVSTNKNKTFRDVVNYQSLYDTSIAKHCPSNEDMTAYISSDFVATLGAKYTCSAGTLPKTIPFFNSTPYFTHTVTDDLTMTRYWSVSYSSPGDSEYCQYKSQIESYFVNMTGGPSHSISDVFTIDMRFEQKTDAQDAIAIVI